MFVSTTSLLSARNTATSTKCEQQGVVVVHLHKMFYELQTLSFGKYYEIFSFSCASCCRYWLSTIILVLKPHRSFSCITYIFSQIFYSTVLSGKFSSPCRLSGLAKTHGVQIKASGAMLRLRLYQSLALLAPSTYEGVLVGRTHVHSCSCIMVVMPYFTHRPWNLSFGIESVFMSTATHCSQSLGTLVHVAQS